MTIEKMSDTIINNQEELLADLQKYNRFCTEFESLLGNDDVFSVYAMAECNNVKINVLGFLEFTSNKGQTKINFSERVDYAKRKKCDNTMAYHIYLKDIKESVPIVVYVDNTKKNDAEWWKYPIMSKDFIKSLHDCSNQKLSDVYDIVCDLNNSEKGWKIKRKFIIEEMIFRKMSFSI